MKYLILPIGVPAIIYLIDVIFKQPRKYRDYAVFFALNLFLEIVFYATSADAIVFEHDFRMEHALIEKGRHPMFKSEEKTQYCWNAWHAYCEEGYKELDEAKKMSLFLPDKATRDYVYFMIENATGMILIAKLKHKLAFILLNAVTIYLKGVYDQWEQIYPHLVKSQECFKQADYYWRLLHPDAK